MGYSLVRLEKIIGGTPLIAKCFEYIETYDTLEEAKIAQKENNQKTLILQNF